MNVGIQRIWPALDLRTEGGIVKLCSAETVFNCFDWPVSTSMSAANETCGRNHSS